MQIMGNITENTEEKKQQENDEKSKVEEGLTKAKTSRKRNKLIAVIAILLIIAGVCIFSYPIVMKTISNYKQDKMQEEIKAVILENMQQQAEKDAEQQEAELTQAAENHVITSYSIHYTKLYELWIMSEAVFMICMMIPLIYMRH